MEYGGCRPHQARARGRSDPSLALALRAGWPAALSVRANGIPARACRAGPSACTGARMACRSGRMPTSSPASKIRGQRRPRTPRRSCEGAALRLGLDPGYIMPAYEDTALWLQKEAELPVNVDPSDSKLSDPEARARIARVFEQGLNNPRGFVLPVQRWNAAPRWRSERWTLRRNHLFLTPGDSPLGLRLPLDSLGYVPPNQYPYIVERDPMEARGKLPVFSLPARPESPERVAPEQLNTSVRGPHRDVGRSPRRRALRLHAAGRANSRIISRWSQRVEATAEEMQLQVHVEGYPPPFDPRVDVIKVTPDPGVIEVNVHPAKNWREAVDITAGSTRTPARHGSVPTNSWSTAATPAPAAAITSCSAAPARRLAVPAPAGSVEEPGALLAAASVAVLFLLGSVHRPDQPGAAHRRSAP